MKIAKTLTIVLMMASVGCFTAMALQIGVANELSKEVTKYEVQIDSLEDPDITTNFERVSFINSRWNNSAAYFAFAAYILLLIQQFITWKYLEKET